MDLILPLSQHVQIGEAEARIESRKLGNVGIQEGHTPSELTQEVKASCQEGFQFLGGEAALRQEAEAIDLGGQ